MITLSPNQTFGPYQLVSPLGAGGMGEVWKARDTRLDRIVALKFARAAFSDRAQREAQAIAALNHPNIATLYDVGPAYLVMEYVEGAPVRPTDDLRKLLEVAAQIADGLAAAHGAGIVHRDLKPDNILVTKSGRVKILDFGLAKQHAATADATAALTITQPGTVVGTIAYMSPEQARGQDLDARSDQFSFGLILYELATGRRAFARDTAPELMTAIIREPAPPLPESVPAPVRWTIDRCLAKDADERYSSTRDLYLELRDMTGRITATSAVSQSPQRRRYWLPGAALIAGLAIGGAATWSSVARDETPEPPLRVTPVATENDFEYQPRFSPDGRSVAYRRLLRGLGQIFLWSRDTATSTQVTNYPASIGLLSWSRDGTTIFGHTGAKLLAFSASGGNPREIELPLLPPGARPVLGPDEKSLLFIASPASAGGERRFQLQQLPFGGGPVRSVADLPIHAEFETATLAVAPDGRQILIARTNGPALIVSYPGGLVREAPAIRNAFYVAWFPDSRTALFTPIVKAGQSSSADLWMSDVDGSPRVLLRGLADELAAPNVSPTGREIALARAETNFDLLQFSTAGAFERELRTTAESETGPTWAPSGAAYAYVETGTGIWTRGADGEHPRLVVSDPLAHSPAWSPDGRRIAFRSRLGVYVVLADGGPRTVLRPPSSAVSWVRVGSVCWSPDGNRIAYSDGPQVGGTLWKIDSSGGGAPVMLSDSHVANAFGTMCAWSPDGKRVAYQADDGVRAVSAGGGDSKLVDSSRVFGFLPNGDLLVAGRQSGASRAFFATVDVSSGKRLATNPLMLPEVYDGVVSIAIRPGGNAVAVGAVKFTSDIFMIDGFPQPATGWRRLFHRWVTPPQETP